MSRLTKLGIVVLIFGFFTVFLGFPASTEVSAALSDGGAVSTAPATILVNGMPVSAGNIVTEKVGGQTVSTVSVDRAKVAPLLGMVPSGAMAVIPVSTGADVVAASMDGQTVMDLEHLNVTVQIKTDKVIYTLPSNLTNIDQLLAQIGGQIKLQDINVRIAMGTPPASTVQNVTDMAKAKNCEIIGEPVDFSISCSVGNNTIPISSYTMYIERLLAIPDGVDQSKISAGILINNDGKITPEPTSVVVFEGKSYVRINSRNSGTYAVVYNPQSFSDMTAHWAKNDVNDMGARLIVGGVGNGLYAPNRPITRAEFAAIVVKGLGLKSVAAEKASFSDVNSSDWFYEAVSTAREYDLISGYQDGSFGPCNQITREEAMMILTRAMKIANLNSTLTADEIQKNLAGFADRQTISQWAESGIAACIQNGIVVGANGSIEPAKPVTRAQVAVMVRKLLLKSKLI